MVFCIIVAMGHVSPAQNRSSSDFESEVNRIVEEMKKEGNYNIGNDDTVRGSSLNDNFNIREFGRWFSESQKQRHLDNQRLTQAWRDNLKLLGYDNVQLQYTIRMNRPRKYKLGEPIFIRDYVKSSSDFLVSMTLDYSRSPFSTMGISLMDADGNEVPMTRNGRLEDERVKSDEKEMVSSRKFLFILSPYNAKELNPGSIVLNQYFDLTRPGIYNLTFHRFAFSKDKQLDEPLSSNTLTIEVTEEFITPDDLKNPGEFNFLPPETTMEKEIVRNTK